jgi:hypothetical protein
MRALVLALSLALLPTSLHAQAAVDEMVEIKEGSPIEVRPDRAYLLFRTPRLKGAVTVEPVLLRIPTASEIERYEQAKAAAYEKALPKLTKAYREALARREERIAKGGDSAAPVPLEPSLERFSFGWNEIPNLQVIDYGDALVMADDERTFLVEALPGDYVLYGLSLAGGAPALFVCFCLGTVGFEAKAGEITDLGYLYGDSARNKSEVPYLADETGYGPSSDTPSVLAAGTIRPARRDSSLPPSLAGRKIVAADYRAVGKYFTPNARGLNRLVPVPGILDYDRGDVIDVKTGRIAPDNF